MAAKKKAAKKVASKVTSAATKITKKVTTKVASKKKATDKNVSGAALADNLIHGIEPYTAKANEKYMNPKQVDHFRDILIAWKTNLLDEVSKTIHLMQDETINHPDPNDRASQETDMSLELRNRDRERKLLKKIDSTIVRVDNDDYGWCDRCGIEIGIRRLEARPTAELCVDCKTLNEIKERQMI
ncbi:MAG: DnaK suppressor protein [Cryomorphaceae bacterium]|jgi:DnaK suppressor protein